MQAILATFFVWPEFLRVFSGTKGENIMLKPSHPSESELMDAARRTLDRRLVAAGSPDPAKTARRARSLRTCHRYANLEDETQQKGAPRDTGAYVPQLSARLENDPNLSDGARRCARKIAELTYRQNRERRLLDVTVTYLMKALGRSRRTVQRYLRVLEREGYIIVKVIGSRFTRMCVGLEVTLCRNVFAGHHRKGWPRKQARKRANPGASKKSLNQTQFFSLESYKEKTTLYGVQQWALKCMDGVFRSLMKTNPLAEAGASDKP